jgi:hypothetical protein
MVVGAGVYLSYGIVIGMLCPNIAVSLTSIFLMWVILQFRVDEVCKVICYADDCLDQGHVCPIMSLGWIFVWCSISGTGFLVAFGCVCCQHAPAVSLAELYPAGMFVSTLLQQT